MTTVIGQKPHEIEIPVNIIYIYNSYGLLIITIPTYKMGRILDYRCMKHRITSIALYIVILWLIVGKKKFYGI